MKNRNFGSWGRTAALVAAAFFAATSSVSAQKTSSVSAQSSGGELEAAESMGLGLQSRFASGSTPVAIDRTQIVPGTPLSVNSTMQKIMSSGSGNSFGGILARYDMSNFGKMFGAGTLEQRTPTNRVDALEEAGDNKVDNVKVARMYPPQLALDFNEFPTRTLESDEARANLKAQIENVVSRFNIDTNSERLRVEPEGNVVYLRGKIRSARLAFVLEGVVGMQPGVEKVVDELEILETEKQKKNVDVFGRPVL